MIKANELRIGIWTQWQNNNQEFDIMLEHLQNPDFWPHIDAGHIIGIPLTEEWLRKLGFNRIVSRGVQPDCTRWESVHHQYKFNDVEIMIRFIEGKVCFNFIIGYSDRWNRQFAQYYVHQLQNLYFALTGQELEIR